MTGFSSSPFKVSSGWWWDRLLTPQRGYARDRLKAFKRNFRRRLGRYDGITLEEPSDNRQGAIISMAAPYMLVDVTARYLNAREELVHRTAADDADGDHPDGVPITLQTQLIIASPLYLLRRVHALCPR